MQKECMALCNNYAVRTQKGKKYKTSLVYAGKCFCSKSMHKFNGARVTCLRTGAERRCDWLNNTCVAFTYTVDELASGLQPIGFEDGDISGEQLAKGVTDEIFKFPDLEVKGRSIYMFLLFCYFLLSLNKNMRSLWNVIHLMH